MKILIYCLSIFLVGCGSEPAADQADSTNEGGPDHVLKTQVQALEKAKGVEQNLQDAAQQRLKDVDSLTTSDEDGS